VKVIPVEARRTLWEVEQQPGSDHWAAEVHA